MCDWYSVGTDEYSVTINPGYYTVTELAAALPVTTATKTQRLHILVLVIILQLMLFIIQQIQPLLIMINMV